MSAGSNRFGHLFQWTTFGESHGPAMGVVIDGCPAGVEFDQELLLENLRARRPGFDNKTSARREADEPEILSGVFQGKTLGTPIALLVRNQDTRSQDYEGIERQARTGHADDLWQDKFQHRDPRGGGRASARETVNWVMAGSVAQMLVRKLQPQIQVKTSLLNVGPLSGADLQGAALDQLIADAKQTGESYGARLQVEVLSPPRGLGEPIFRKLKSELSQAYMGINAVAGVSLGKGWEAGTQRGSDFHRAEQTTVYGGVRGGLSTGETIQFTLSFKPTSSIGSIAKEGRHDPCVALRAGPILSALTWSVLADQLLMSRLNLV